VLPEAEQVFLLLARIEVLYKFYIIFFHIKATACLQV